MNSNNQKWKIYFITLISFSLVHSIKTLWASIKSNLTIPPFNYQVWVIGSIDMMIFFLIGLFMNIFGHRVNQFGAKKTLVIILGVLLVLVNVVGIFLYLNLTAVALYIIFYGLGVGITSSLAWPACLYMVSFYFNENDRIYLSLWNSGTQIGQFIALITYFVISNSNQLPPQTSFFIEGAYILIILLCAIFMIPHNFKKQIVIRDNYPEVENPKTLQDKIKQIKQKYLQMEQEGGQNKVSHKHRTSQQKLHNQSQKQNNGIQKQNLDQINSQTGSQSETKGQSRSKSQRSSKKVGIFEVWLLPGVALNTLALGFTKSVNAIIISWMVYYLISIDLGTEAFIISIFWSIGIILGGLICSHLNKNLNYIFFSVEMIAAAICFILLQQFHIAIFQTQIFVIVITCSLFFGGPYNLLHTVIPLYLSNQKQVQQYENGKTAIIALTESFSLICCALSLIIVPSLGISKMHIVCSIYCFIGGFLLLAENHRKGRIQEMNMLRQKLKAHKKNPSVKSIR